ncbi:MAG TPA: DUF4345 domain-containing protein [Segetibacter sp.]|jgi:nitrate reductase gamma subunit
MKTKTIRFASIGFISLSVLSIFSVSMMAFINPQQVMDLVQVNLGNNDAYSSIRGVYGGVGISIVGVIIYLSRLSLSKALGFLTMFWGMYGLSRVITIVVEGKLGAFGTQWLITEACFTAISLGLFAASYGRSRFAVN